MPMNSVVVTGVGVISPLANDFSALMAGLYANESGVRSFPELGEIGGLRSLVAAKVADIDPKIVPRKFRRSMSQMSIYAYLAAQQALEMSGYPQELLGNGRFGVSLGTTLGSTETIEEFFRDYFTDHSLERIKSGLFFQIMGHSAAANLTQSLGITGRLIAPAAACATGCQTIGFGYEQIAFGRQDAMLCGGTEEFHPLTTAIFDVMNAASTGFNEQPQAVPRPFDAQRDGVVCGEGCGLLLLESRSHAEARKAPILGEICGFATNSDNSSIANPDAGAMADCMRQALADAGIDAEQIDYVNAHATGTLQGDSAEAQAIAQIFADRVPVSSFKGHLGHSLAASGALELSGCIGILQQQRLVATRNLEKVAEDCGAICHIMAPEDRRVRYILKNNFAMGGVNSTVILRSYVHD